MPNTLFKCLTGGIVSLSAQLRRLDENLGRYEKRYLYEDFKGPKQCKFVEIVVY